MKRFVFHIILPIVFLVTAALADAAGSEPKAAFFRSLEFYGSGVWKIPPGDFSSASQKLEGGAKLNFSHLSIIGSWGEDKFRWGAKAVLDPKIFFLRTEALCGTLSFSQGISRLKNPLLSVPTAIHKSTYLTPGISPSLPSFTSSKKDIAFALCISPSSRVPWFPNVQAAYVTGGEWYASAFRHFSFAHLPDASVSFTGGSFRYKKQNADSWFLTYPYAPLKNYASLECEMNLVFPNVRVTSASGFCENPYGSALFWQRLYASLLLEKFSLHGAAFFGDRNLVCADGSIPRGHFQAQINPQFCFSFGDIPFAAGLLFHGERCSLKNRTIEFYERYTLRLDSSFGAGRFKLLFLNGASYNTESEKMSLSSKMNLMLRNTTLLSNSTVSFSAEDTSRSLTFSQQFTPARKKRHSFVRLTSCGLSEKLNFAEGDFKNSLTTVSLALGGNPGKVVWNLKLEASIPLAPTP